MVWYFEDVFIVCFRSFGFDTAVEEAVNAIKAARVEAGCVPNGKLSHPTIFTIVHSSNFKLPNFMLLLCLCANEFMYVS